jgi:hypothetical protein
MNFEHGEGYRLAAVLVALGQTQSAGSGVLVRPGG